MSSNHPRRGAALVRVLASRYTPAALGLLLLLALGAWATPVRVQQVVIDPNTGESRTVTAWDTSRWQAVSAFWWQALLLALALAAVLLGAWSGRSRLLARASAAPFFAASLLFHALLLLSLGAVPLARAVVERAEVIRVRQAAELFDEPRSPSPGGRPAYEKVADPPAQDAGPPTLARQAAVPADVPDGAEVLAPTIPPHAARGLPPERLLFVPPRQPEVVPRPPPIERRAAGALKPVELKLDMPEPPPPEVAPRDEPLKERRVAPLRADAVVPASGGPAELRLPDLKRRRPTDLRPEVAALPRDAKASPPAPPARRPPGRIAPAAPREPDAELKPEATPADRPSPDARVRLPRLAPTPPAEAPEERSRPRLPPKGPARADVPTPVPLETKPAFGPSADRLPRAAARTDRPARFEEELPAPLALRRPEERRRSVARYGGTRESEAAVERGLDWLAAHQNADGSWALHNFHANCKHPRCPDAGTVVSDPAGTGVALLPFLAAGHTPKSGKHRRTVARALHWLVSHQGPDGTWPAPADPRPMYGHGLASIALCEAYGMTRDPKLRGPAQKALDYVVKAQHPGTGGWRYRPNQPADTSVVGWQVMALKSGEMAGLTVPAGAFAGVKRWLSSVEGNRPVGGLFGYQSATPTPAMTAQGLLCLQYLGARRDDPRLRAGTDYLLKHLPRAGAETSYYWYHATQVMYHMQGKHWKAWNGRMRDLLVSSQETRGPLAGSWKPVDHREKPGGRVYSTALRLLMLEVYYRHLPLYRRLGE